MQGWAIVLNYCLLSLEVWRTKHPGLTGVFFFFLGGTCHPGLSRPAETWRFVLEILKEGGSHNSLFRTYLHAKMLLCDLLILCNEGDLAMKRPLMDPHNPIPIKNERHRKTYLLVNLLKTFSHRDMLTEINRPSHQISRTYSLCHFSQ